MEHTKKFVLMDPRFVRPSMRDKVLSRLDQDISNILDGDASDEAKAKSYAATLHHFKNIYNPQTPRSETVEEKPPPAANKNLKYKKFLEFLKRKKQSKKNRETRKLVKFGTASHADDVSEVDSDKEINADWDQLSEALPNASTPNFQDYTQRQNLLRQSVKRNLGDKAIRYWADLSDSLEKTPTKRKTRQSTRQQTKRKLWVQY